MTLKDKKHWSTQSEAARDEVRDAVEETVDWLLEYRREAAWTVGTVAVLGAACGLFLYGKHARANAAWDKYAQAELYAFSNHVPEAQALIAQIAEQNASPTASTLALILKGDMHYQRAEYDRALAAYDQAQNESDALRPYALASKIAALEAAGKAADCAAAAQSFLDSYADHLLAAQVHAGLARCQLTLGQTDAAKTTFQRISLQYPNTAWAAEANARLQNIAK